jgi:DNA replication protein DnaC
MNNEAHRGMIGLGRLGELLGSPTKLEKAEGFCDEHGHFSTYIFRGIAAKCPVCCDREIASAARKRWFDDRVMAIKKHMHIPGRFSESGFRDWIPVSQSAAEVKASVVQYVRTIQEKPAAWKSLILSGAPGTVKTHLLCAVVRNLADSGVAARYVTLHEMLADIKTAYSDNSKSEVGQILRYVQCDFLALDEIDVMRGSDNDKALLFAVVNGRYNDLKPMAIATNQMPEALSEFVTDRVLDRLQEGALTLRCDWQSARAGA